MRIEPIHPHQSKSRSRDSIDRLSWVDVRLYVTRKAPPLNRRLDIYLLTRRIRTVGSLKRSPTNAGEDTSAM